MKRYPSLELQQEIHDIIRLYGQESDVTIYQAIGVLEIVKLDLAKMLKQAQRPGDIE